MEEPTVSIWKNHLLFSTTTRDGSLARPGAVIPALIRRRQENSEFKASLGFMVSPCLNTKTDNQNNRFQTYCAELKKPSPKGTC
jgi:hypothetical protein